MSHIKWSASYPTPSSKPFEVTHLEEWYQAWAQLPIASIQASNYNSTGVNLPPAADPFLFAALPHCRHLTSLSFHHCLCPSAVFEFAASSTHLVDLRVSGYFWKTILTATNLTHATKWLTSAPVQRICFRNFYVDPTVPHSVRNKFFTALFGCPTLIFFEGYALDIPEFELLPDTVMYMHTLRFIYCTIPPAAFQSMARALRQSTKVNMVCLLKLNEKEPDGIDFAAIFDSAWVEFLDAVGHSGVKELKVMNCCLGDSHWLQLGPILQKTKLQKLTLYDNGITDKGAAFIAQAIQSNDSLSEVILTKNRLTFDGVIALVIASTQRHVAALTELCVSLQYDSDRHVLRNFDEAKMAELCETARERGMRLRL
ncbi:Aste57867_2383 [Aphanomyces stellatus]|uniref:Aste57867_2383 protein n=1 Tax=Aphanomyces stellatus TaxID=120398 RepID=A0A485KBQ8_9STRA|nr:hypothetical protein As57867_002377 [Aphanomyces stellatus]VFT79584.1 Aste57867_2383 [Aphanomyces stellatus]